MANYSKNKFEYADESQVAYARTQETKPQSSRRGHYGRSGQRPLGTNGIHRRRNKRWSW